MKRGERTGLKALLSAVSIIAVFAALCFGVIYTLIKTGVMDVGGEDERSKTAPDPAAHSASGVMNETVEAEFGKEQLQTVLSNVPFCDGYYFRAYAMYIGRYGVDGVGGNFKIEAYDVYKSGDKYKIVIYDGNMNEKRRVVCDGTRVLEAANGKSEIYQPSETFSFSRLLPMPDFSAFQTENYKITSSEYSNGEYRLSCYFTELEMTDTIHVSENTGAITYMRSVFEGKTFYEYSLLEFDTEYAFSANEFYVSTRE